MTWYLLRRGGKVFKSMHPTKTLAERLQAVMEQGSLTKRDLQRWFDRPYATVRCWVIGKQEPWEIWRDDVENKLRALEELVRSHKDLPVVPPSYSPKDRAEMIQGLIDERDARIPRIRSSSRR